MVGVGVAMLLGAFERIRLGEYVSGGEWECECGSQYECVRVRDHEDEIARRNNDNDDERKGYRESRYSLGK